MWRMSILCYMDKTFPLAFCSPSSFVYDVYVLFLYRDILSVNLFNV